MSVDFDQNDEFGSYRILSQENNQSRISPILSCIMSVKNGEKFLDKCIKSIVEQTFKDFEFIIVNDGSVDLSLNKLLEWVSRDNRIVLVDNEKNEGLTKSLIRALNQSKGKYIARQDVDDWSSPQRFFRQMQHMKECDVVFCRSIINDRKVSPKWITVMMYRFWVKYKNPFIHGTVMFRKELYRSIGGYNSDFQYAQDYDLFLRLLKRKGVKMKYLMEVLYHSIKNSECLSYSKHVEQQMFAHRALKKNL